VLGIEGAAGEISTGDFDGGYLSAAFVHSEDEFFCFGILVNIHFLVKDTALVQKLFRSPAIGTPTRCVETNCFHLG
jgi:hypothetical protein